MTASASREVNDGQGSPYAFMHQVVDIWTGAARWVGIDLDGGPRHNQWPCGTRASVRGRGPQSRVQNGRKSRSSRTRRCMGREVDDTRERDARRRWRGRFVVSL
jgi:hypothetical protein